MVDGEEKTDGGKTNTEIIDADRFTQTGRQKRR